MVLFREAPLERITHYHQHDPERKKYISDTLAEKLAEISFLGQRENPSTISPREFEIVSLFAGRKTVRYLTRSNIQTSTVKVRTRPVCFR